YYPKDPDGAIPIAYLWARTITCEGPGCGTEVPLIRSLWLARKAKRSIALRLIPNPPDKRVDFAIIHDAKVTDVKDGTVKRGSATCPCCGYTTPVVSVRKQLKARRGGADDARMFCVVTTKSTEQGRFYRVPVQRDLDAVQRAKEELERRKREWTGELSLVPDEPTPMGGGSGAGRAFSQRHYGMDKFENLFTSRQALALTTLAFFVKKVGDREKTNDAKKINIPVQTVLSFALDKQADSNSSLCAWRPTSQDIGHTFGRQALSITWDFVEGNIFSGSTRDWLNAIEGTYKSLTCLDSKIHEGRAEICSAVNLPLPDDCSNGFFSDPPYYDAVPYADLSDFFYVWLKRTIREFYPDLLSSQLSPKQDECIVDEIKGKEKEYFERTMASAMAEGRRVLMPKGIGVIVFAHKSTSGWEAQLQAMIGAGWTITASWPIDTEMGTRLRAHNSAALASSIHLVCRPREKHEGVFHSDEIGEWSDVLAELPIRIHEWMPRLAAEGVVGADAIFACLGPALEIFSRYSSVEKASGEQITLKEYLEKVWEAVEKEALTLIFEGADTSGFEEDARLTAMWLWTLKGGVNGESASAMNIDDLESESDDDQNVNEKSIKTTGYSLEYDTARKIAQGLGAHPETMPTLIEIKKGNARLISVAERAPYLFGKQELTSQRKSRNRDSQLTLFPDEVAPEESISTNTLGELAGIGKTNLDRVHQSMLLFGNGQSEGLKKFLVEDAIGKDPQFKKLAQALVALYPAGSVEKRWAEGVMSRMKGLGL
ncbi:MAG: DUF1156 domain-containing protein, partial [Deltaproteobacteria bacterium]